MPQDEPGIMKQSFIALGLTAMLSVCAYAQSVGQPASGTFTIIHTNFLGSLWNAAHARASIVSQDGGESFRVPGGAIWAFGDTFRGARSARGTPHYAGGAFAPAIAFLADQASPYPPAFNFLTSSNGVGAPAIDFLPDERPAERYRLWPLGGIYLNGQCYLYYSLIEVFGNGAFDFRCVGSGLARSKVPLGHYERLQPQGNWRFPVEPTQIIEADGWLYLYGIKEFKGQQGATLARVRPEKIEDPEAYEFYSGAGPVFSSKQETAAVLVTNVPGQVAVAWNPYLKKYVLASASDFNHPREICLQVADAPVGPWSPPVARLEVPARRQGKRVEMVYCAYWHPELFRKDGRVMTLTYSLGLQKAGFDANCEMVQIELESQAP